MRDRMRRIEAAEVDRRRDEVGRILLALLTERDARKDAETERRRRRQMMQRARELGRVVGSADLGGF